MTLSPAFPGLKALFLLQDLEGAFELGIFREDLVLGEVFDLVRGLRLLVVFELRFDVRRYAGAPDKVPVRGQPLGDAEQDGRTIAQGVLGEHGPGAEGLLANY